jgi:hypothetical protein
MNDGTVELMMTYKFDMTGFNFGIHDHNYLVKK